MMSPGYPRLKVIVLSLFYFQTTQCMYGDLKGKGEALLVTDDKGNPLGLATPMVRGETFHVGPSPNPEQHSPSGDIEKYFHSVKQLRKPTPGLYKEYLDHVMKYTQSEKPGSSNTAPANLYWATILDDYIEVSLKEWALYNDLDPALFTREFASGKKRSPSEEKRSVTGVENTRRYFPMKELVDIYYDLYRECSSPNFNEYKQVTAIKRIYIQAVELVYKHNLLNEAGFKKLFEDWCKPSGFNQKMFQNFYHSGKEHEDYFFGNGKILLTRRHSSHFLNMFKVDPEAKANLLFMFLKSDVERYLPGHNLSNFQRKAKQWKECFFQKNSLLFALRSETEGYLAFVTHVEENLMDLITSFVDPQFWAKNWRKSEDLKLMGRILEFVDENFLKTQPESKIPIITRLQYQFEQNQVRNRLNLIFSRIQALLELEDFSKYLNKSFPLKEKKGITVPISPQEELEFIEHEIYNSKIQTEYRNNLTMKTEDLEGCKKEIQDKIRSLQEKIEKLRRQSSSSENSHSRILNFF
ncbi:hypothetical protein PGTUg99_037776 [Puccinia graminis f. sp. tritici]|uniref:Uncharacterized protein n=1 Tax=Puccinia graminis f. sp. tritici TaxID=56615 RepID=A0A5B0R9Y1_PUCGR|nr:hypothetical protein PGTUg99_037776 [Puccinia graminis f. sp. tritici]